MNGQTPEQRREWGRRGAAASLRWRQEHPEEYARAMASVRSALRGRRQRAPWESAWWKYADGDQQ